MYGSLVEWKNLEITAVLDSKVEARGVPGRLGAPRLSAKTAKSSEKARAETPNRNLRSTNARPLPAPSPETGQSAPHLVHAAIGGMGGVTPFPDKC